MQKLVIYFARSKKLAIVFLFFLLSIIFISFNQVNASNDGPHPPGYPRNYYEFEEGYWYDDDNDPTNDDVWISVRRATAYFPGLVPCGVGVCLEQWEEFYYDDHGGIEGEHVPGWHCPAYATYTTPYNLSGFIKEGHHCTICHFFIMFSGIITFIFTTLAPFLAVIILAVGGVMLAFAGGNPELIKKGWATIKGVSIGLVLIYGSFIITAAFFGVLGFIQWEGFSGNLFSVRNCAIIRISIHPPVIPPAIP